jgi:haloalkane dehalogenase
MIPRAPQERGAAAGQRVQDALAKDERPMLILWADSDPILPPHVGERFAAAIGGPAPRPIPDAGHFLQEDQGPLIGGLIADWLTAD